jgi:hypothetical protein
VLCHEKGVIPSPQANCKLQNLVCREHSRRNTEMPQLAVVPQHDTVALSRYLGKMDLGSSRRTSNDEIPRTRFKTPPGGKTRGSPPRLSVGLEDINDLEVGFLHTLDLLLK